MPVYIQGGKAVVVDGKVATSIDCCCAEGVTCCSPWMVDCCDPAEEEDGICHLPGLTLPGVCPDACALGACFADDVCAQRTMADCEFIGGGFQGFDTCCDEDNPGYFTRDCGGACLTPSCHDQYTESKCDDAEGDWMGAGTSCCRKGRCCKWDGFVITCEEDVPLSACENALSNWREGETCDSKPCEGACCNGAFCIITDNVECTAYDAYCFAHDCADGYGYSFGSSCDINPCCPSGPGAGCTVCCSDDPEQTPGCAGHLNPGDCFPWETEHQDGGCCWQGFVGGCAFCHSE